MSRAEGGTACYGGIEAELLVYLLLTHRRPSTHAFVLFEHCECLCARFIVERRHDIPRTTLRHSPT